MWPLEGCSAGIGAPRRFVWNQPLKIAGRSRARWACGQAAFEPAHMPTCPGAVAGVEILSIQIEALFTSALGLQVPWAVADVKFDTAKHRIDFDVVCKAPWQATSRQSGRRSQRRR